MSVLMTLSTQGLEFEVRSSGIAPYPDTLGFVYLAESCCDDSVADGGYVGTWERFVELYPQFKDVTPPPTWHEVCFGEREYPFQYQHIADVSHVD